MDNIKPPNPPGSPPPAGSHPHTPPPFSPPGGGGGGGYYQAGTGWQGFKDWMGEDNYKKFQSQLCQSISKEMKKQQEQMHKAALRLQKSETGDDDIYSN